MTSSDRYKRLSARYEALTARAATGESLIPEMAYADFLKSQTQPSHPHAVPADELVRMYRSEKPRPQTRPLSANAIRERTQESLDDGAKRLKAIEDLMWQHRQEQRELKRAELDVARQRRQLQQQMKDYDTKVSQRRSDEQRTLLSSEANLVHFQQKDLHQQGQVTKERTQQVLVGRQRLNEQTKKFMKTESELSWRYQVLLESLERKRAEVARLSTDYEARIRSKEEEQHLLKQELASLAISLNMEASKRRHGDADTTRQTTRDVTRARQDSQSREDGARMAQRGVVKAGRQYENQHRELEQSVKARHDTLQAKHRQEGRNLLDLRTRQQLNAEQQRFTGRETEHTQLDLAGQELTSKMQVVEARKRARAQEEAEQRREKNARELHTWERRSEAQDNEARKKEHEDRLKQLARVVSHHDGLEHGLYTSARSAEADRRKLSVSVTTMQEELAKLRRINAKKLKEAAVVAERAEVALSQRLVREEAELSRAANLREENLHSLAAHRQRTKDDRHRLSDERRELHRRERIANRTALLTDA